MLTKTRIKVVEKVGGTTYQPQYQMLPFIWTDMMEDLVFNSVYDNLKEAQQRVDLYYERRVEQVVRDMNAKIKSVTYVKYP